eukprot:CAMPEP_0170755978 /NCGR_PEP_ID=MMETSP0437-20130122/13792_1 /TAXON_ID=0 /ORGANISM="Sexangularia sp." /LENGTH=715 /DNA_ID=CAMNT_0011095155 /DNA_START=38 /DNA_END=2182 /DNA_ORIENTATION=-
MPILRLGSNILPQSPNPLVMIPPPILLQPLCATNDAPVETSSSGPARCSRCRAYANPFDNAACALCQKQVEEIVNHTVGVVTELGGGIRSATVDYVASAAYMSRIPDPGATLFVIDLAVLDGHPSQQDKANAAGASALEVASTLASLAAAEKTLTSWATRAPDALVGLATFTSSSVTVYEVTDTGAVRAHAVVDARDPWPVLPPVAAFVPLDQGLPALRGLIASLTKRVRQVEAAIRAAGPSYHPGPRTRSAVGAALGLGVELLAEVGGRLVLLTGSCSPASKADGTLLRPSTATSSTPEDMVRPVGKGKRDSDVGALARKCAEQHVAVYLFAATDAGPRELASLSHIVRTSGGRLYAYDSKCGGFSSSAFATEFGRLVESPFGFEALLRVRTSMGFSAKQYFGSHFQVNASDVALACVDADTVLCVELEYDDADSLLAPSSDKGANVGNTPPAYLQAAMLYTSSSGERLIRVHTVEVPTSPRPADVFGSLDQSVIASYLAFRAADSVMAASSTAKAARQAVVKHVVDLLAAYRKHCASSMSNAATSSLLMPETLGRLPSLAGALIRSPLLSRSASLTPDERVVSGSLLLPLVAYLVPQLYPLSDWRSLSAESAFDWPTALPLAVERMDPTKIFLMVQATRARFWFGSQSDSQLASVVYGTPLQQFLGALTDSWSCAYSLRVEQYYESQVGGIVPLLDGFVEDGAADALSLQAFL